MKFWKLEYSSYIVIFALNYDDCRYIACCERVFACREIKQKIIIIKKKKAKKHAVSFFLSHTDTYCNDKLIET